MFSRTATAVQFVREASKKAGGSSRNGRKSPGKRLGLKCGDGEGGIASGNLFISMHVYMY